MTRHDVTPFRSPDQDRIEELASSLGFDLTDTEVADYTTLVDAAVDGMSAVRGVDPFVSPLRPESLEDRTGGYRPDADEDPLNAWLRKTAVPPTDDGPLDGLTVGLKDSIALAGYEMTAGSTVLEGFVPRIDAPVVQRLLDNGATVAGKLNMESFAWSGTGDLSDFGPVLNPHSPDHLAGGSSSGSGAAPAAGDCDVALGTDQAGSIRIPSSWCGLVGLKPTFGLVPYTGILPLEHTIDHVGPMAPTVEAVERVMGVIAGRHTVDGIPTDDRQSATADPPTFEGAARAPTDGLAVGVLEEGFGWEASESGVDETVRTAIEALEPAVDLVEPVSLPRHRDGVSIWAPIATAGGVRNLLDAGVGLNNRTWAWPGLTKALGAFKRTGMDDLPPSVKRTALAAAHLEDAYGMVPYARARGAAFRLRQGYDQLLSEYDALVLPTTVTTAFPVDPDAGRLETLIREAATILNTCPFNVTGHPAVTVPCGEHDGLPVGKMFVGAHFDERTILSLAGAVERSDATWST